MTCEKGVLPERIGNGIYEMNINGEYEFLSGCNLPDRSLEENWKLIHIDGNTRTLKNRRGTDSLCRKENLPAGVTCQESCHPFMRYRSSLAADKSESKAPEAEVSSCDSEATTLVLWQMPKQRRV